MEEGEAKQTRSNQIQSGQARGNESKKEGKQHKSKTVMIVAGKKDPHFPPETDDKKDTENTDKLVPASQLAWLVSHLPSKTTTTTINNIGSCVYGWFLCLWMMIVDHDGWVGGYSSSSFIPHFEGRSNSTKNSLYWAGPGK